MGTEMEWKLAVPGVSLLDEITEWDSVRLLIAENPRLYHMRSSYYDTTDQYFSKRRITIRRRMENDTSVICVKAPLPGAGTYNQHGEWELASDDVFSALKQLVRMGAPEEILERPDLVSLWGADFQRKAVLLRFPDGSACELALDHGVLFGPAASLPLCEMELEMKEGAPDSTLTLLKDLQVRFSLQIEEKSKLARARALDNP